MYKDIIKKYLVDNRAGMLKDLAYVTSFATVNGPAEENAPFGKKCAEGLAAAVEMYEKNGFDTELCAKDGYALVKFGIDSEKYIGVFSHSDVVPVNPEDWITTKPFEMKEANGYVFGRGVSDNKSAVVGMMYLMRAFRDLKLPVTHNIVTFIGSNEETGMQDVAAFTRDRRMPDISFVPDSGFPFCVGERAIMRCDVKCRQPFDTVIGLNGGTAYNIVMPKLVCTVKKTEKAAEWASRVDEGYFSYKDNGDTLEITVEGVATHAGGPKNGVSALKRLADLVTASGCISQNDNMIFGLISKALSDTDGISLGIADNDEVLGDLSCANGMVWLEDGRTVFTLDIRYGRNPTDEWIKNNIGAALENVFEACPHSHMPAFLIEESHPYVSALLDAYRNASGDAESKPFFMAGGTYAKHLKNAFSCGVTFGDENRPEMPEGHGNAHQSDEMLSVDAWIEALSIIGEMMLAADKII